MPLSKGHGSSRNTPPGLSCSCIALACGILLQIPLGSSQKLGFFETCISSQRSFVVLHTSYISQIKVSAILKEMIYIHSSVGGEKISVALLDSAPVPEAQGVAVGGSARMTWWSDAQSGLSGHGCDPEHRFTPLYDLTHMRHSSYQPSPERKGDDL
jgi:hypothetical protein